MFCVRLFLSDSVSVFAPEPDSKQMGVFFSTIFSALFGRKEVRVLILGLDNAGKTTILCACGWGAVVVWGNCVTLDI